MATVSQAFSERTESIDSDLGSLVVVSFYKFADFPEHADFRKPLKDLCEKLVWRFFYLIQKCRFLVSVYERLSLYLRVFVLIMKIWFRF